MTALQPLTKTAAAPRSIFFSNNMKTCFGQMTAVGKRHHRPIRRAVVVAHRLTATFTTGQAARRIVVNGVVGKADVWLNRHRAGDQHGDRHRRLHKVQLRRHRKPARRHELAGHQGLPERSDEDVHRR